VVKESCVEKYECPYCNEIYDTHIDADCCADDCHSNDRLDIIEHERVLRFQCEMCGKEYKKSSKAENCEEKHKKNNDKCYIKYQQEQSRLKLEEAANHKDQTKLKW